MTHIGFIGGGNMASAIINGMLKNGFAAQHISVVEHNSNARAHLSTLGVAVFDHLNQVTQPDVWLLAVKPQDMQNALTQLSPLLNRNQMLISIAAGLTVETLVQWAQHDKIARTMPNTPSLVGQGVTGIYAPSPLFSSSEQALIEQLFSAVGSSVWLDSEAAIDAITAISGSGPAYVFYMMEHLTAAATALGFDAASAQNLVKNTFAGAIALAQTSEDSFTVLREKVTSKGGTTAAAIAAFDAHHVGQGLQTGALAAHTRAAEMAIELAK